MHNKTTTTSSLISCFSNLFLTVVSFAHPLFVSFCIWFLLLTSRYRLSLLSLLTHSDTQCVCSSALSRLCKHVCVSQINPIAQLKIFFRRDAAVVLCPLDRHAVLDVVCVLRNDVSQQACLCFGDELLKFPSLNVLSLPFLKHLSRSQTSHSIKATNSVSFKGTAHPKMSLFVSLFTHCRILKQF